MMLESYFGKVDLRTHLMLIMTIHDPRTRVAHNCPKAPRTLAGSNK